MYDQTVPATTNASGTTKVNLEGVSIYYDPHNNPNIVSITYNGPLYHHGAQEIYLHTGTSRTPHGWDNTHDYKMQPTHNGWRTEVSIEPQQSLCFCFRDNNDKWDNNNRHNWTISVNPQF